MIQFVNIIFAYFGRYAAITDINKDVDGKGTLQRFNELIGADIDANLYPLITNLLANIYIASTAFSQYIPYLESMFGYTTTTIYLSQDINIRRCVLKHITTLYSVRGSRRGYSILIGMMGLTMSSLTEYFGSDTFDGPPYMFDDTGGTFDSFCPSCSEYSLEITGTAQNLNAAQITAIYSIIEFNQPINAVLSQVTYNGTVLQPVLGDFNGDFNNDFLI